MKKEFNNFIKKAKQNKLSAAEKNVMRSKILEFISFNPIRGKTPVIRERNYLSIFEVRYFAKAASLVLIFAVVVGGSGVSLAASSALPGEKLYSVKVNVNETIEDGFARTTEARAAVHSKKVERRLVEAQALDKENKLSPELQKVVEEKLAEHIDKLAEDIADLQAEGNLELALETTSNITPVLEAHKEILEENEEDNVTAEENSDVLIARVENSIREVEDSENALIAAVDNGHNADAVAMTMMTKIVEEPDPQIEIIKQAQDDIEELSDSVEKVVKSRIRTAKEKISAIKAAREIEISIVETPLPTETLPTIEENQNKEVVTEPAVKTDLSIEPTIEPKNVVEDKEEFDIDAKIKEAERLIREADIKLDNGRFKEALSLAQEVNRIAGEIEAFKKLKALDLTQKANEIKEALKAETAESI